MKEKEIIAGIDVSKATLDICLLIEQKTEHYQIKNQQKSIRAFFKKIRKAHTSARLIVCMENTGYYNWPCYEVFDELKLILYVVNPLHLKKSLGLTRGKNDTIDALRIARFITLHKTELKPAIIPRREIRVMQALLAQRNRLIETRKKISVPASELALIADKELSKNILKSSQKMAEQINLQILNIEKLLNQLIDNDTELKQQYQYITSVQGVGKVLAWTILIKTNEFKSIKDPRKLACYAGVVPFDYQSGSSIYKKPRVSVMADKTLKKLLHLAAMRVIQIKGELQNYYLRKVDEGKNKMAVINAVRNKIIARICAVINNKRMYNNYLLLS